ncbi:MAG: CPXCG motif-containing cysteine-rich protein [Gammaproteobacteria bacterium]
MHLLRAPGPASACSPEYWDCRALLSERTVTCPCCGEDISIVLDLSIPEQRYVEDCSVCCRPILLTYSSEAGKLLEFEAQAEGGE